MDSFGGRGRHEWVWNGTRLAGVESAEVVRISCSKVVKDARLLDVTSLPDGWL